MELVCAQASVHLFGNTFFSGLLSFFDEKKHLSSSSFLLMMSIDHGHIFVLYFNEYKIATLHQFLTANINRLILKL